MNAFVYMETKEEFFSCYWTEWQKNVVLKDKTGKFYDNLQRQRHKAIRAMELLRKAVSTVSKCQSASAAMGNNPLVGT